jgi:ribosome biogenesis GTPase
LIKGRVVRNTGSHYIVEAENGNEISCKVKGNFRLKGIRTTNPVAVGDIVELADAPDKKDDTTYIKAIEPRRNYIIRRASNLSKESHIIAANIDCAMLVVTLAHPATSTTFIDRFLATAEAYNVNAIIVINKIDLLGDDEDRELLDAVQYLYTSIGYKVITVSAKNDIGIEILRNEIKGKTVLLSGNSGVGKSTIINQLIPGIELRTAEISAVHDTGMHTTTFSEMFHLPGEGNGDIIDTPGIRGFGTIDFDKYEVAHYFREIFRESEQCKFGNCTHTHEPGCAVITAVQEQRIAQSRYNSYISILSDNADDKYRKPY